MKSIKVIFGCAGGGKTTRAMNLIKQHISEGYEPNQIMYVSFSKKAATEGISRLPVKGIQASTIHSMCFRGVRATMDTMMGFAKYKDFGTKAGLNLTGYTSTEEGFVGKDDDYLTYDNIYRNNKKLAKRMVQNLESDKAVWFMEQYSKYKKLFGYRDFTDLLTDYCVKDLFEPNVKIAFIDEAQDLTTLQWNVVIKAFRAVDIMYVLGDDLQAIYEFAGADVNALLEIHGDFEFLKYSHRMPNNLALKAKSLSDLIIKKVDKEFVGDEKRVGICRHISDVDELTFDKDKTYYLLARNNMHLKIYKELCMSRSLSFMERGVPFVSKTDQKTIAECISKNQPWQKVVNWDFEKCQYYKSVLEHDSFEEVPRINISSIHGVKGGEADVVVILSDVTKAVHKNAEESLDSELRVFYVGVTRTKQELIIVEPHTKYSFEQLGVL
jgi:superfamily I DNA/RNA helicase